MTAYRLPLTFLVALPLAVAACGGEGLSLPPEGEAADIEILEGGENQSARINEELPEALLVRVTDSRGQPVPGAEVVFTFPDGAEAGVALPGSARTDADGLATAKLKLGTRAGTYNGIAEVPVAEGVTPVRDTFTVTSRAADAAGIRLVSGNPQTGVVNSPLSLPLVVEVNDIEGNPIPNIPIQWTAEGGGSVSETANVTGPNGQASVSRTLGPTAGPQTTVARAEVAGSPITFTHTATAGSAAGITKAGGDNQSAGAGTKLALPLIVEVRDGLGNPIVGRAVTWVVGTGGGSVTPLESTTDAQGRASTEWTLGPAAGPNTVNAVASGVGNVTFTATATAGSPSAANSEVSASPSTITAGSGQSTITVVVRDGSNNPVAGASVTLASTGGGNSFTPASASTAANGVATFTFSSTVAEVKTITATAGGVTISDQATVTVQKTSSSIAITDEGPDPSTVGQPIEIEFVVTGSGGTPTGEVVVTMTNGPETCRATLTDGRGSCVLTPATAGPASNNNRRTITATYNGDAQFSGDTDSENHRVIPAGPSSTTTTITGDTPEPSDAGAPVTVSFTVTSGSGTPSGTVEVTAEGGGSCSATVAQGSCQLTPVAAGQVITLTARYQGGSGFSASEDTEEHTVNAAPTNTPPNAVPDGYLSASDQELRVETRAVGVLGNDTDSDGPAELIARNPSTPSQGTVTLNSDGTFVYTPNAGALGGDSFTYEAFDGAAASTATVTITFTGLRLK